jgi:hypothetical protein
LREWQGGGGGRGRQMPRGAKKFYKPKLYLPFFFISFFSFCKLVIPFLHSPLIILLYVFYFFPKIVKVSADLSAVRRQ